MKTLTCKKHNVKKMIYGSFRNDEVIQVCPICSKIAQKKVDVKNLKIDIKKHIAQVKQEMKEYLEYNNERISNLQKPYTKEVIDFIIADEIKSRKEYGCDFYIKGDGKGVSKFYNGKGTTKKEE